jgi:hypothetical protein
MKNTEAKLIAVDGKRQIYKMLNVNYVHIYKQGDIYILCTRNIVFKTEYISHIPIESITNEEFESIKVFTYKGKKESPILHKIRTEAIDYLKKTNAFKK